MLKKTSKGENNKSFFFPILSMQCCAADRATYRKQQTPQLWTGEGEGVWILLFPKVTLFEYNVSTIFSAIVDLDEKGQK